MIISIIITLIIVHLYKRSNPHKADQSFKRLQLASSALFSLGHGLNDAQKVMGIIGAALIYYHVEMLHDPIYLNLESADVLIILHSIISGFLWFRLLRLL
jgi:PiT family inorganic phosphate transporter